MTKAKLIRKNAVLSEYKAGMGLREIAKKYSIGLKTVQEYLRDYRMSEYEEKEKKRKERSASIVKEDKAGTDRREIAEKHSVSVQTVNDTIRQDKASKAPEDLLYKELMCPAQHKSYLRKWAYKKQGKSIKTPEGRMIVLNAYPHIVECAKQHMNGFIVTTFTHGEVFYMNQGG